MTTTMEQSRPEGMTDLLFDRGTLLHLYIGRWTGNRKMSQQDLLLEDVDEKALNVGFKKLMPYEWHSRFQHIESEARSLLASMSVEFPIGNARFMFYRTVPTFLRRIQPLKDRWDRAVQEFVDEYDDLKQSQLNLLEQQAQKLVDQELASYRQGSPEYRERALALSEWKEQQRAKNWALYPKSSEIASRFTFMWRMFKVSPVQGVEQMNTLDQQQLAEVQETLQREVSNWARTASTQVHQALGAAAENAQSMLVANGKLNPRSLRPLFEAFEQFRAIEFSGTSNFNETIDNIRRQFLVTGSDGSADYQATADRINSNTGALSDLLSTIGNLALDQVAEEAGIQALQRTGEFGRFVDLGD